MRSLGITRLSISLPQSPLKVSPDIGTELMMYAVRELTFQ